MGECVAPPRGQLCGPRDVTASYGATSFVRVEGARVLAGDPDTLQKQPLFSKVRMGVLLHLSKWVCLRLPDDAARYFARPLRVDALAKAAAMASGQTECVEKRGMQRLLRA
ncbi:hypothetical protein HPB50_003827 [Hyalomma asiaticum]|uniref:Uncharacterized protein n=1 Tax=Hyalomma asiaticum TaxID=266040 RepID=A0ACB7TAK1_HYAAI|nr:hypothetical protein HPB50_003827 [Hyalomma asiaticum]